MEELSTGKFHCSPLLGSIRNLWNIGGAVGLFRLDTSKFDHLGPLLGVVGNKLPEIGGRARKDRALLDEACPDARIGKTRVDLPIELVDDLGGRVLGRTYAEPGARLVAR